ncbi:MAG: serine hydrolase domain-containing protein [Chitinophagia bacterium]
MQKFKVFVLLFVLFSIIFYVLDNRYKRIEIPSILVSKEVNISEPAKLNEQDLSLKRSSEVFYDQTLRTSRFNGAILVTRNGKIVFEKYNGLRDVLSGDPIDSSTSFHLASVSKTFTAMAILRLREKGLLSLEESASAYLTGLPYTKITIRDLLTHRSGLPNYVHFAEKLGWDTHAYLTNQDILNMLIQHAPKLKAGRPNAYFDYCNTNYALLALIVEKVSQNSFAEFLDTEFFKPLGMKHTFVFDISMREKVLQSYKFNNRKEPMMFLDGIYGDKNIYSTPRDMMRWDNALIPGKFFASQSLEEAFKGYSYERRGLRNYGLGWRLVEMPSGKKIIYHNGWWHGNNTVFSRLPSDSTAIIVLGNKFNRGIYKAKKIAGAFSGYGLQMEDDD